VLRGDAGILHRCARILNRIGEVGRTFGENLGRAVDIFEDVGDRILVLVAEQLG
jgi:hypothetical protein